MDLKAVICDDDSAMVRIVSHLLSRSGFKVVAAYDGAEGVEAVRRERPHLLILDIDMPGKSGIEVLEDLQSDVIMPYVIVLSADEAPATQERAKALGARETLVKPFQPAVLVGRVRQLVEGGKL